MRRIDRAAAAYAPEREERDEFDISDEEIPVVSMKTKASKTEPKTATKKPIKDAKPAKSILKKASAAESDSEGESEGDFDDDGDSESEADEEEKPAKFIVSRAVKSKLEDDDDEIAAL